MSLEKAQKVDVCVPSLEPLDEEFLRLLERSIPVNRILTTAIKGRAAARNELHAKVETEFFASVDSDIYLGPGWFDKLSPPLRSSTQTGGVYGTRDGAPQLRCLLQDGLLRAEAVRGIVIPECFHVHEDSYLLQKMVLRGWKFASVQASFEHRQRDRDYHSEYVLIGLAKKRLGLETGRTILKRAALSPYFSLRALAATKDPSRARRKFAEMLLPAEGFFLKDHIPLKARLSSRHRLPVYGMANWTFAPWNLRGVSTALEWDPITPFPERWPAAFLYEWQESGTDRETLTMRHKPTGYTLTMHTFYWKLMLWEMCLNKKWDRWYRPDFPLMGKTVLDVGAGEGETALYFLSLGASRVIAVEPDAEMVPFLKRNVEENAWPVEVVDRPFDPSLLSLSHDFLKMDCEGCESSLLQIRGDLGPCAVETHSQEVHDALQKRFPLRELEPFRNVGMLRGDSYF